MKPSPSKTYSTALRPMTDWARGATIYQIFLRAFTPDGTLKAAEKLLDHVANLGFSIIYLCPLVEADDDMDVSGWSPRQKESAVGNPKNPYRQKDYYTIDSEYGTEDDLISFVRRAHELGLKVILDLVYLHCGPSAVFISEHPEFLKHHEDGSILTNDWNFPILNFENVGLREYLWQNMEHFILKFDVDGYRCDVSSKIPLDFWVEGRRRIEALKPDLFMLAESAPPSIAEQEYAFDVSYGFRYTYLLNDVLEKNVPVSELRELLENFGEERMGARLLRAFDNHDICNDHKELRQEVLCPNEAIHAALVLGFSLDGMPFFYNGQEVADANRHTLWSNRMHGHNHVIDWSNALTQKGKARLEFVKSLVALRKCEKALSEGSTQWLDTTAPEGILSFTRELAGERILAIFNLSPLPLSATLNAALELSNANLLAQFGLELRDEGAVIVVECQAYGYLLMKL
ncbi:alpha-amylase family glycosyl hydrolase [Coraliomargarita algicola]|uniref:Alpha-amylase family glycosyl hydrolase n=1 Tax=Coraliomargarita algicola TaxID=3092156 RepID=A0ABZ0RP60_9BACT|nr:alpha-amylase family glycosyl hydrolase [Coraliomargarita sp. J2-16]WPJ96760.1 alpha-amylase family glycosyl hydrolase [Coraliomargarita sp. J2-16]